MDHDTLSALPGYELQYDDMTGTTVIAATQAQLLTDAAQGGISFQYTVGGYCFVSIQHPGFNGLASALQIRTDHHFYDLTLNTAMMASMGIDLNTLASNGIIMLVTPDCADMLKDLAASENAKIRMRATQTSGDYTDYPVPQSVKDVTALFMEAFDEDLRPLFETSGEMVLLESLMGPVITSKEMELYVPDESDAAAAEPAEYIPGVDFYEIQLMDVYGTVGIYVNVENIGEQVIDAVNMYVFTYDAYGNQIDLNGVNRVLYDITGIHLAPGEHTALEDGIDLGVMGNVHSAKVVIYKYHTADGTTVVVPADQWVQVAVEKDYTDRETVKQVQQALNEHGYECGTPDGLAGRNTASAISRFQADNGRPATGEITWQLLYDLGLATE